MGPRASTSAGQGAVAGPDGEAPRSFRVLRDRRHFREPRSLPVPREASLAQVAESPLGQGLDLVGAFRRPGAALPAAPGPAERRPSGQVANSWHEEPDA